MRSRQVSEPGRAEGALHGGAQIRGGNGASNRSDYVAERLAQLAETRSAGERLGTKVDLRKLCDVSVGTFNEGVKLAQSRGFITSRPGPGGGIFVAERSPFVRLGNSMLALDGSESVADAVRMRDALDPLLIEDVLRHSSATDVHEMRERLAAMAAAVHADDPIAFVEANWALHARIAQVSPSAILRLVYLSLLEVVMTYTLAATPAEGPLPDYVRRRHDLAVALVGAIADRDADAATRLILEHNEMLRNEPFDPQHV